MKRLVACCLLALWVGVGAASDEGNALPRGVIELESYPAPPLRLEDMDGNAYDLKEDRGSVVFVHFWASWCGPCREEMPAIQRMWNVLEQEGLKIALVNTAEDEDTLFTFLAAHAPDIRPLMDADGQITEAWKPRGLPATYLVDRAGQVRYQALGGRPWDEAAYIDFLRVLLAEELD
ncbi:MAG: TlpA disulfide reductase family protein [Thiohalobacteraceae bacterium]